MQRKLRQIPTEEVPRTTFTFSQISLFLEPNEIPELGNEMSEKLELKKEK